MEKIARRVYESSAGVNIWCTRLLQQIYENQDKINEVVKWINEHEKQLHKPIPINFYEREKKLKLLEQAKRKKDGNEAKTKNSIGKIT